MESNGWEHYKEEASLVAPPVLIVYEVRPRGADANRIHSLDVFFATGQSWNLYRKHSDHQTEVID